MKFTVDRYFTLPFCFLRKLNETKNISLEKIRHNVLKRPKRRKFCAALITNIHPYLTDYFRVEFIEELSKYKKVDMGGRYKNNVGGRVKNKMNFLLDDRKCQPKPHYSSIIFWIFEGRVIKLSKK